MAVQLIQSTDTLETGFRQKANSSFGSIVVSVTPLITSGNFTGIIKLNCFDGSFINIDLRTLYYTQTQITQLLSSIQNSPYSGGWNSSLPGGYAVLSVVDHNGNLWRSNSSGNSDAPGTSPAWTGLLNIPPTPLAPIIIPAGTPRPFNIDMTAGFLPLFGANPTVLRQIAKVIDEVTTDTTLVQYDDIDVYYNYADNTCTSLLSLDIWGHSDGSAGNGKFNEKTYVTIKL